MHRLPLATLLALLAVPGLVGAATVTYDVQPVDTLVDGEIVVAPGTQVDYIITALVQSDTTEPDNDGLAVFQLDLLTNTGVEQLPIDAFDDVIATNFPSGQQTGTVQGDRVVGIGAGQLPIGQPGFPGVGVDAPATLARGRINTPETEGTFQIQIASDDLTAVVLAPPDSGSLTLPATAAVGDGFTIRTSQSAGSSDTTTGDTGNDGSTDGNTSDGSSNSTGQNTTDTLTPPAMALAAAGLIAAVVIVTGFFFGGLVGVQVAIAALFVLMALALGNAAG
jgi:hypothetical protein